jgi:hypothetical protein
MFYCEDCDIEMVKRNKNRHLLSSKHLKNIGENPYLNGKIYKIVCLDENDDRTYIGSTIIPLEERLKKHKKDKKRYERGAYHNVSSYPILHNCKIELIEDYPCDNEIELKKREQYHIDKNDCINKNRAYITDEARKEIRKNNYEKHKENEIKQMKIYRVKHNEIIKAYKSKKIDCECGICYTNQHKLRHFKTKRHQDGINKLSFDEKRQHIEKHKKNRNSMFNGIMFGYLEGYDILSNTLKFNNKEVNK